MLFKKETETSRCAYRLEQYVFIFTPLLSICCDTGGALVLIKIGGQMGLFFPENVVKELLLWLRYMSYMSYGVERSWC